MDDVLQRGLEFIRETVTRHRGGRILVVSHGILLIVLMARLLRVESLPMVENASLSILEQDTQGWRCTLWNSTHERGSVGRTTNRSRQTHRLEGSAAMDQ